LSNANLTPRSPVIFGCGGERLSPEEQSFFQATRPFGFILFGRNCTAPQQVRTLVEELRSTVDDAGAPVLIDQEGGRVQRLGPPNWRQRPPARAIGRLDQCDRSQARHAAWLAGRLIAADLEALGITVDCAPVLDVPATGSHDVIGDRAFSDCADTVTVLGASFCEGLLDGGVLPVIKHVPGHGRARVDSHHDLPAVDDHLAALTITDFAPFAALAGMPLAMTAHILYRQLDPASVATLSPIIVQQVIRDQIGFNGVLISDDISMNALPGPLGERARGALDAGCDLVLHCNGEIEEMKQVGNAVGPLGPLAIERWQSAEAMRRTVQDFDRPRAELELEALVGLEEASLNGH
jgi:beta-N-acetylhexosaminidase